MDCLSYDILKELVTEYQKCEDPKIFAKILKKLDRLVIRTVIKCKNTFSQLDGVSFDDLYQSAIVGLYRGIKTAKMIQSGAEIQARIISYMKLEIRSNFSDIIKDNFLELKEPFVSGDSVYNDLQIEDIFNCIQKLIENGDIDVEAFQIVKMRYLLGMKIIEIAEKMGKSPSAVCKEIKDTLVKIRYFLRLKNVEY